MKGAESERSISKDHHPALQALVKLCLEKEKDESLYYGTSGLCIWSTDAGKYLDSIKVDGSSSHSMCDSSAQYGSEITLYRQVRNEFGGLLSFISKHSDVFECIRNGGVVQSKYIHRRFRFRLRDKLRSPTTGIGIIMRDASDAIELSLCDNHEYHTSKEVSQKYIEHQRNSSDNRIRQNILRTKAKAFEASCCNSTLTVKSALVGKHLDSIQLMDKSHPTSLLVKVKESHGSLRCFILERNNEFVMVNDRANVNSKSPRFRIGITQTNNERELPLEVECLMPINLRTLVTDSIVLNGGKSSLDSIITVLKSNESVTEIPCNSFDEVTIYYGNVLRFLMEETSLFLVDGDKSNGYTVQLCPFNT